MSTTESRALTIPSFCAKHGFSRAQWYVLVKRGESPRVYKIGKLVRVSPDAEADWVRQREAVEAERETAA